MNKKMEETLLDKGYLIIAPIGTSMLPLIRPNRDVTVLKKKTLPPKKYDVVLYKRNSGSYILHRILKITPDGYIICGDNQFIKEYGVKEEQILGIMDGFYRDNKYIDTSSFLYQLYVYLWCFSLSFRRIILYILHRFRYLKNVKK